MQQPRHGLFNLLFIKEQTENLINEIFQFVGSASRWEFNETLSLLHRRKKDWQVPILPKGCPLSTFSVCELNFQVRNVTGCTLTAILTNHLFNFILFLFFPLCLGHSKLHSNNLRLRFRLISIGPLKTLLLLHSQPIKLLVSKLSVEYLS